MTAAARISATAFLIFVTATAAWAQTPVQQVAQRTERSMDFPRLLDHPARLNVDDVSLEAALLELTRSSGVPLAFSPARLPKHVRASCACETVTVRDALDRLLAGTWLDYAELRGQVVLFPARLPEPERAPRLLDFRTVGVLASSVVAGIRDLVPFRAQEAAVAGVVVNAGTGEPLQGAQVVVEGTGRGTVTDAEGHFRIEGLDGRELSLQVTMLGYRTVTRTVSIGDENIRLALEETAIELERLVVTGTAFPARVRSLPNPISVITAEEIEAKGSTNITDLLRGEIPGVMALSDGQFDIRSFIFVRGNAGGGAQDLIKIYIDGVEVANPNYLSTIDPKSIERIEVVRGPQASAIYGSDAASGVLQIFTKKGTPGLARPRLDLQASAGVVESEYTPSDAGTPLTQDYSLGVSGGGESFSYRAAGSYVTVGEWVKHYGSRTLSFSGGLRAVQGPLTAELTALWTDRDYDFGNTPLFLRFPAGACAQCGNPDYQNNSEYAPSQNTMALKLAYQATPKWRHTLTLGDDQNRFAFHQPEPSYNTPADTFVRLSNRETRRRSVRYHTAYDAELASGVTARFTGGVDYWSYDVQGSFASNLLNAFGTVRTSASTSTIFYNDGWWNAGYFGMAELGLGDQLFVTLAARVEDNPNLGEEYGRALAPRAGVSYVRGLGSAELKLRAQWGKGVRPPPGVARAGQVASPTTVYLPNPAIAPEEKSGWDAGVDVYWGSRASLSLTRFDEEAENLIQAVDIDPTATPRTRQYQNIGVVGMEGWEAEGSVTVGRVTLAANYAYSDNVVRKVTEATAANPNATLQVGDRTFFAPKHSGGGRVTARVGRGSVSVDGSVMAGWRMLDFIAFYGWIYGGEPYRGSIRDYYVEYPALWKWNLRAEQAVTERWGAFLKVDNLWNDQGADLYNFNVMPGRTMVVGVRFTY